MSAWYGLHPDVHPYTLTPAELAAYVEDMNARLNKPQ